MIYLSPFFMEFHLHLNILTYAGNSCIALSLPLRASIVNQYSLSACLLPLILYSPGFCPPIQGSIVSSFAFWPN